MTTSTGLILPEWRTIHIGTHTSSEALVQDLLRNGNAINNWGFDMLSKIQLAESPGLVKLRRASVGQLGFENGSLYEPIRKRAQELGLGLCPNEVGPPTSTAIFGPTYGRRASYLDGTCSR